MKLIDTITKKFQRLLYWSYICIMVLWLLFPIFLILYASFQGTLEVELIPEKLSLESYRQIPKSYWDSLFFTLSLALVSATVSIMVTIPASWSVIRSKNRYNNIINSIVLLPLLLPKIVIGIALLRFFLPLRLTNNYYGLLLALVGTSGIPISYRYMTAIIEGIDERLEQAAMSLGASRAQTMLKITIPLIGPGIVVSWLFVFMSNFMNFLIIYFIAGPGANPISVRLFSDVVERGALPYSVAMSAILILIALIFYSIISVWLGPKYLSGVIFAKSEN